MRNPILYVFLHCEDIEKPYTRWPPDAIFKKNILTHVRLYAMENYK